MPETYHLKHVKDLKSSCLKVIESWEHGDLAGAVNDMREKLMVLDQCRPTRKRWTPKIIIVTEGGKVVQGFTANLDFQEIEILEASGPDYYERIKEIRHTMHPAQVRAWRLKE